MLSPVEAGFFTLTCWVNHINPVHPFDKLRANGIYVVQLRFLGLSKATRLKINPMFWQSGQISKQVMRILFWTHLIQASIGVVSFIYYFPVLRLIGKDWELISSLVVPLAGWGVGGCTAIVLQLIHFLLALISRNCSG